MTTNNPTDMLNATTRLDFSAEDFKSAVEDMEIAIRPYAIYCHPDHKDVLDKELGKEYLVVSNPAVPLNKTYVVDRRKLTLSELFKPIAIV